jgi:rhomboid-like protein
VLSVAAALRDQPTAALHSMFDAVFRPSLFFIVLTCSLIFLYSHKGGSARALYRHFTLANDNITAGRIHTLLSHAFLHASPIHLLANMYCLTSFSDVLLRRWSDTEYMGFFGFSAIFGAVFSLVLMNVLFRGAARLRMPNASQLLNPAVGASAVVCAAIAYCACRYPHMGIGIVLLPFTRVEVGEALPYLMAFEVLGLIWVFVGRYSFIGHAAHLGGYIAGLLVFEMEKARRMKQKPQALRVYYRG